MLLCYKKVPFHCGRLAILQFLTGHMFHFFASLSERKMTRASFGQPYANVWYLPGSLVLERIPWLIFKFILELIPSSNLVNFTKQLYIEFYPLKSFIRLLALFQKTWCSTYRLLRWFCYSFYCHLSKCSLNLFPFFNLEKARYRWFLSYRKMTLIDVIPCNRKHSIFIIFYSVIKNLKVPIG